MLGKNFFAPIIAAITFAETPWIWIPTFQMYNLGVLFVEERDVSKKSIDHGDRYQLIVRSKPTVQLRITIKVAMYGRFYKIEDFSLQADKKSAITHSSQPKYLYSSRIRCTIFELNSSFVSSLASFEGPDTSDPHNKR